MKKQDNEYISLKEAAQLSGYSADYIGQLIRSGKISGKQVFLNVAWMTTREDVEEYMRKIKKDTETPKTFIGRLSSVTDSIEGLQRIYASAIWIVIAMFVCVALFLAYVLAVAIDHRLEERQLEKIQYDNR